MESSTHSAAVEKTGRILKIHKSRKNAKKKKMKTILLSILCLLGIRAFSQTSVDVYVINQGGCPYGLIDTWVSPNGAGNMSLVSIDSMGFQNVHHFTINDTTYPITLTICLYVGATQAPFPPQTPGCITQVLNSPGQSITIVADCSILEVIDLGFNKSEISVFPNPAENKINVKADATLVGSVYTVYDNTGKVVLSGKINAENTSVELGNLSGGIYLFSVGDNLKQTLKIIKE